jgi:TonB family protein
MKTLTLILFISTLSFSQEKKPFIYPESYAVAPTIIGGLDSLQMKLKWPAVADSSNIGGYVYVLAYLDTIGNVDSAEVVKGLGPDFDQEVLRVVKLTKFTPAYRHKLVTPINAVNRKYILIPTPIIWALSIPFLPK